MKTVALSFCASSLCAAMVLSGCGQSQPATETPSSASDSPSATPLPPAPMGIRPPGWLSWNAKKNGALIYAANYYSSEILVYSESGGPSIGEITQGVDSPYGLYVDKNGNLYVANEGNNTVTAYAAGSTTPYQTWSQDLDEPLYPIVDSSGDLFVSNRVGGTVVEYLAGSSSAYQVLHTPGREADGMDFDSQGDLYVAYRGSDKGVHSSIEEFAPGATHGKVLGMSLNLPQGLIVDNSGNILVVETGRRDRIDLFEPGQKDRSQTIRTRLGYTLVQLAIEANESELFASTLEGFNGSIFTIAYPFPASGIMSQLIQLDYRIQGIALSNGQTF